MAADPDMIQIVPRLPPLLDGVGDYALRVAHWLRDHTGIVCHFIACAPNEVQARTVDGFAVDIPDRRQSQQLVDLLQRLNPGGQAPVVCQMSGYGYSPDGAPHWVVDGLRGYQRQGGVRIATVFHELFATSVPWRRTFWYTARQKTVVRELAGLSDAALCTLERNERVIRRWNPELPITRLAVPSNMPEPVNLPAWHTREAALVVFGLASSRMRAYAQAQVLQQVCRALQVETIYDVGPELARYPAMPGVKLVRTGVLLPPQVSHILMRCRYGYLAYEPQTLAKSGVMAAYSSHGLATITPRSHGAIASDGLQSGRHYLAAGELPTASVAHLQAAAQAAAHWYAGHDVAAHAAWYRSLVRPGAQTPVPP